jgi:hypothetical protein
MAEALPVYYSVSADGRTVAEAEVSGIAAARELIVGHIDAPGLTGGQRDQAGYRTLLRAALSQITAGQATVESWGDGPGRVRACEQLGLTTAESCPGWELDLATHPLPLPSG